MMSSAGPDHHTTDLVASPTKVDAVVAVSIDGLMSQALTDLGREGLPNLWQLLDEGLSTLNARTSRYRTNTLPNHTGMLTSRRVSTPRGHHVRINHDPGGTIHHRAGHYVHSVFDTVHNRGHRTALYASKSKFRLFNRSYNARNGHRDSGGIDYGRDKIDYFRVNDDNRGLTTNMLDRWKNHGPAAFTFLHLSAPDRAGHRTSWMSPRYITKVKRVDTQVGRILADLRERQAEGLQPMLIVTADHGGTPGTKHHTGYTRADNYTIPLMVWSPGVVGPGDPAQAWPALEDPGSSRPTYRGNQPARNIHLANIATYYLQMPPVWRSFLDPWGRLNR